jgi:uncharacterized protein YkwD
MWTGLALVGLSIVVIAASIVAPNVVGFSAEDSPLVSGEGAFAPSGDELNETRVEQLVVQELNRERTRRDRTRLGTRRDLSAVADSYAQTMAEYGDSGHELGGTTPEQRYQETGVACRYTGENAANTWYRTEIDTFDGGHYYANASELAGGLVTQWMQSPPHRRIMLSDQHTAVGVGISIKWEKDAWAVYAVADFCR